MSVVDQVKERLDIIEVIQGYVPLKKAGRNYKGLCPFHTEKTPSFIVFPDSGTWHCFGACGVGGDVFSFIMKRENVDFGEALKILAQRAGVELEPRSPRSAEADQRQALLHEINQAAAVYFHHLLLNNGEAARALAYMERRGFSRETLVRFQVGYALDQWDALLHYLRGKGYAPADLAEAGVLTERDDKSGYYDRFRGRIMFPIRDAQGRTIGFGGRVMGDGVPKYLNSPQSPIFDKSSALYGLDLARAGIRTADLAVIVEGYTDVMMAHQAGFDNVVAQMGTALTESQLRLLKRSSKRFVLALDPDTAGDQATLRGLDVARQVLDREMVPVPTAQGLIRFEERLAADIRIASLPEGRDPDEVIRDDPAAWASLVAQARPILDYYFRALTADLDLSSARGKADAVSRLGPLVMTLGDRVQRKHYLQQLSRLVQVEEQALTEQIRRTPAAGRPAPARAERPTARPERPAERVPQTREEYCLVAALAYPDLLEEGDRVLAECGEASLQPADLSRAEDRAIFSTWREWLAGRGAPGALEEFQAAQDPALQGRLETLLREHALQPRVPDDLLRDKVLEATLHLRRDNLFRRNRDLRFLQEDAQAAGDREATIGYGQTIRELSARIGRLDKAIEARSMMGRRRREDAALRVPLAEE